MKIGIVGSEGVVGAAVTYGMQKLGHEVMKHDIILDTKIEDVLGTEVCYICVPTPPKESGQCDISIVEQVVVKLNELKYSGVIAIKSTVEPGTTKRLAEIHDSLICFVPEFLRERCAISDFTEDHDICIIGSDGPHWDLIFKIVKDSHGHYPTEFIHMTPTEAELAKYFNNIYNAALVTFANSFYEVCKIYDADYTAIKNAMVKRPHIHDMYIDCNENFRGFGGMCLPKDTKAIDFACQILPNVVFFNMLLEQNSKYKTTILEGMRSSD